MRTSNNFSSSIFGGGDSRPTPPSARQLTRIESNKTFQSSGFGNNQSAGMGSATNRVTNSIQGHDIFNTGVASKVTHNDHRDKVVATRYNQNHGGKAIFQDGSAMPTPKTRD